MVGVGDVVVAVVFHVVMAPFVIVSANPAAAVVAVAVAHVIVSAVIII